MKTVIFGGSGFLGSHVADALTDAGHEVVIFDLVRSPHLRPNQEMIIGDILDLRQVTAAVQGASYVYHLAGMADIDEASAKPLEAVRANVLGTAHVLEACRTSGVKRIVFASSIYVYSRLGSFYRCTKQACEMLIRDYHDSFGLEYTVLRYGSLYGPRANSFNIIRHYLEQAIGVRKIRRAGDGEELREYVHVLDAAAASVRVLGDQYRNQFVIITGNQAVKVRDLLYMIKEIMGGDVKIEFEAPVASTHYRITPYSFRPDTARRIVLDSYHDLGAGLLDLVYEIHAERSDGSLPGSGSKRPHDISS